MADIYKYLIGVGIGAVLGLLLALLRQKKAPASESFAQVADQLGDKFQRANADMAARVEQIKSDLRVELADRLQKGLTDVRNTVDQQLKDGRTDSKEGRQELSKTLGEMALQQTKTLESLKLAIDHKLSQIQMDNATKLDQMRQTVDEKLQGTLDKRLGESFALVSRQLEQVHKGLGEMQTLATGVGDLKKVLTNVKTRGTWGEMQLGNLLEQVLTPDQYDKNVATKSGSNDRVEFAIKLPGRDALTNKEVWLPIDAKFPKEDYERLVTASESGDAVAVEEIGKQLETRVRAEAKNIRDKYLEPPGTTDFGILFLPSEGLYAEVLRRPGLVDGLQREFRVNVTGPTTLAALLNSLQMGFRTLAIQKRSSEVWAVLGAVKSEFGNFALVMTAVQKKLQEASNVVEKANVRTRAIEKKLRDVQELPSTQSSALLPEMDMEADSPTPPIPAD